MRLRVSRKKFLCVMLLLILMFVFLVLAEAISTATDFITYSQNMVPLILTTYVVQVIGLHFLLPAKRLIMYLVVVLYYTFHMSHVVLNAVGYDFASNERNNIYFRFSGDMCIEATKVALIAGISIYVGYIIYYILHNDTTYYNGDIDILDLKTPEYIRFYNPVFTFFLIGVGLVADVYYSFTAIVAEYTYGYVAVADSTSTLSYAIRLASYLLLSGVVLYIQNEGVTKFKKTICVIVFCLYKLLIMASGLRAYSLINIFLVAYVYYRMTNKTQKLRLKHIILALIALQLGGGIIVGIRESRITGIDIGVIISYMFDIRSNIIFNMMGEFGITQNLLCEILARNSGIGTGGSQLVSSFILIIPWASYIFPNYDFSGRILETSLNVHNYGGSYVADLLFDFGTGGIVISCIILGIFMGLVFEKYEFSIQRRSLLNVAIYTPIIMEFIYCVRSSMAKLPRMIVWYLMLIILIKAISTRRVSRIRGRINGKK